MGEVKLIFFILNPQNETLPPSLCFKKVKMILVFGGTTEGRAAVETLDEAGQTVCKQHIFPRLFYALFVL